VEDNKVRIGLTSHPVSRVLSSPGKGGKGTKKKKRYCNAIPGIKRRKRKRKRLRGIKPAEQNIEMQSTREQVQNDETRPCFCNLHKKRRREVKKKKTKTEKHKIKKRSLQILRLATLLCFGNQSCAEKREESCERKKKKKKRSSSSGTSIKVVLPRIRFCRISQKLDTRGERRDQALIGLAESPSRQFLDPQMPVRRATLGELQELESATSITLPRSMQGAAREFATKSVGKCKI
jgi:hypothetical protein